MRKLRFADYFRLVDCVLMLVGIGFLLTVMILNSIEDYTQYEIWMISTLGSMLISQLIIFFRPISIIRFLAVLIGFLIVPMCIVSVVMGYFYFYSFYNIDIFNYRRSSYFVFLGLNFLYLIPTSMHFIWYGLISMD